MGGSLLKQVGRGFLWKRALVFALVALLMQAGVIVGAVMFGAPSMETLRARYKADAELRVGWKGESRGMVMLWRVNAPDLARPGIAAGSWTDFNQAWLPSEEEAIPSDLREVFESVRASGAQGKHVSAVYHVEAWGWPFRWAVSGTIVRSTEDVETIGLRVDDAKITQNVRGRLPRVVPTRVRAWPLVWTCVVCVAVGIASEGLWCGFVAWRARRRVRAGRCGACGYPRAEGAAGGRCSECGAAG